VITADSNVFIYLHDEAAPAKRATAVEVVSALMRRDARIALQVVGEFQNVLRRRLRVPPWLAAQEARNLLESFDTFAPTRESAIRALEQLAAGRLSYWDGLLLAAAAEAGCTTLLSEDMHDGAEVFGVRIVNPFAADGLSAGARAALAL
jgi:predicted nucleic acid-binding protein